MALVKISLKNNKLSLIMYYIEKEGDIIVNEQENKNSHAGKRSHTNSVSRKIRNVTE